MSRHILYILFFLLPLVHTKLFDTLFIPTTLSVAGNFEFTKVMFFQALSGVIIFVFALEKFSLKEKIHLPIQKLILINLIVGVLILSTFFSLSPYISFWGNGDKSHSFLMFLSLVGIYIVLQNTAKKVLARLIHISLISLGLVCLLALKEYFIPTFHYGELSSRAIGSFGHPNYLALYLLMFFPILIDTIKLHKNQGYISLGILILGIVTLIITKSILGIFLGVGYILYACIYKKHTQIKKYKKHILLLLFSSISLIGYFYLPPEKLHSFLSRFYVWETTFRITASDPKIFFFGGGFETLSIYFNTFKSPYLYIFENYGFTADRPHNLFLSVVYHTGIVGLGILLYILSIFWKHIQKIGFGKYEAACFLCIVFCFFNYPSIATLLLGVLFISIISPGKKNSGYSIGCFFACIVIFSSIGVYTSISQYHSEFLAKQGHYAEAFEVFPHSSYAYNIGESVLGRQYDPLPSEHYYYSQIQNFRDIPFHCGELTELFGSVENYFYCGKVLERIGEKELSHSYYESGLQRLPDLWNDDSKYWDNYFVKKTITGNRFFSKKFSDLKSILEKVGE